MPVTISANPRTRTGVTLTLTAGPASAAVLFQVKHPGGGTQVIPATTTGAGGATTTCVPAEPGPMTVTVVQAPPPTIVTGPVTAVVQ
jgi:hypothetical protein